MPIYLYSKEVVSSTKKVIVKGQEVIIKEKDMREEILASDIVDLGPSFPGIKIFKGSPKTSDSLKKNSFVLWYPQFFKTEDTSTFKMDKIIAKKLKSMDICSLYLGVGLHHNPFAFPIDRTIQATNPSSQSKYICFISKKEQQKIMDTFNQRISFSDRQGYDFITESLVGIRKTIPEISESLEIIKLDLVDVVDELTKLVNLNDNAKQAFDFWEKNEADFQNPAKFNLDVARLKNLKKTVLMRKAVDNGRNQTNNPYFTLLAHVTEYLKQV